VHKADSLCRLVWVEDDQIQENSLVLARVFEQFDMFNRFPANVKEQRSGFISGVRL
jgi:hypothetical protein